MVDAEARSARRGRRLLIVLLVLLLVLLPLYLWPLRGGGRGLPGASARPGSPTDPRNAAALARVPPEVWDALMGEGGSPRAAASSGATPRNLTMIGSLEEVVADGLGPGPSPEAPGRLARAMIAALDGPPDPEGSGSSGGGSLSTPGPLLSGPPGGAPGTPGAPSAFGWGGYPMLADLGPGGGGGLRLPGPGATFAPDGLGDPGAPAPTPEPATLLLVGSNVVLLGAAAWKRRRRCRETPAIG